MKILAPAVDFKSGQAVIKAGAREVFICGDEKIFQDFSFSGRGKKSPNNDSNCCSYTELKELVVYAHENNTRVNYLANTPFFKNGIVSESNRLEKYLLQYIEDGIKAGVDSIIVGNMGLLYGIYKRKYPIDIHASVFLRTMNSEQIKLLKTFNVTRVTLSYHMRMDEIKKIIRNNGIEVEVMGHLGCSFYNGACSFVHDLGKCSNNSSDVGISCKGVYTAELDEYKVTGRIFDKEKICSLCSTNELDKLGVEALKIVGRDRNYDVNLEIIKLYSDHLNKKYDKEELMNKLPKWWKRKYCKCNRCKFI